MKGRAEVRGYTLTEMMVVVAITASVAVAFALLLGKNITFFQHMRVRQQMMLDSRRCIETIQQALRNGKARTLIISTPNAASIVPNSRVDFALQIPLVSGATSYAIYLEGNGVYAKEYVPGQTRAPRLLASHVTGLMFTGDYRNPSILSVTLRIDAPLDASRDPTRVSTLILPNQVVHLAETP